MGLELAFLFAAWYLLLRTFGFSMFLIVDQDCSVLRAIQGSWKMTRGRFWGLMHLVFVSVIYLLCGCGLCYVGLLLFFPLVIHAWTGWYLEVCSHSSERRSDFSRK